MSGERQLRVVGQRYGGAGITEDPSVSPPFVVRDDVIEVSAQGDVLRVVSPAAQRVAPQCPHFGTCGGCQYQMIEGQEQGNVKRRILGDELRGAGVEFPLEIPAHTGEPYGYRNRIRLRVQRVANALRFGYNVRGTTTFLPIVTCPISAPPFLPIVEGLLALAASDREAAHWLSATHELELFANDDLTRVQMTLFCSARTKSPQGSLTRVLNALRATAPHVAGIAAEAFDPRTGPTGRTLDAAGANGLSYRVALADGSDETYWISRGGFFQVNRFLLPQLVSLVTTGRSGNLAWDLFAGVGLFSRILARSFAKVTAVEASPTAAGDLDIAMKKLGAQHSVVQQTTLDFLRAAIVQRDRPDLIVLDPPRAGAGAKACELLVRLAPQQVVYVSCDPTTLARDLRVLQDGGYVIEALDVVDLFPQTFHLESVAVLRRPR